MLPLQELPTGKNAPLPEYPRPQLVRDSYCCLNGQWEFAITKEEHPPKSWQGEITVPYSPESKLSGVKKVVQPDDFLWYRRQFLLPAFFMKDRLLLHFGAVDQCCVVYFNGKKAGHHEGGYLPFTLDVTSLIKKGRGGRSKQELMVMVVDDTDQTVFSYGRQRLQPNGRWQASQSGIWQTVWLESVPDSYIKELTITPQYDEGSVEVLVTTTGGASPAQGEIAIYAKNTLVTTGTFTPGIKQQLDLPGFLSWHPGNPFLYTLVVQSGSDKVQGYFGMRKFSLEKPPGKPACFYINNKPFPIAGITTQGIYQQSLYTPPADKAMVDDIRFAKKCGFNTLRLHGKIECQRWYYHCDRLGMLVWQDLPGGGVPAPEKRLGKFLPAIVAKRRPARLFGRVGAEGRAVFMYEMKKSAALLYNLPCLGAWSLFQNGHGQFDEHAIAMQLKELVGTRLVQQATGLYDNGSGELQSIRIKKRRKGIQMLPEENGHLPVLDEAGDIGYLPPSGFADTTPCARTICDTREQYAASLAAYYMDTLLPLAAQGLRTFFLYQLADAGDEVNGLLSADHAYQKLHPEGLARLNSLWLAATE